MVDTHQTNPNWAKNHGALVHVQPKACHAKAVARGGSQGSAAPRGGCSPLGASLPLLAVVVPPRHAEAVECMLRAKYSFQHHLLPYINRGVPPST
jgi:hypothetical protein